jgi:hypothetical protein
MAASLHYGLQGDTVYLHPVSTSMSSGGACGWIPAARRASHAISMLIPALCIELHVTAPELSNHVAVCPNLDDAHCDMPDHGRIGQDTAVTVGSIMLCVPCKLPKMVCNGPAGCARRLLSSGLGAVGFVIGCAIQPSEATVMKELRVCKSACLCDLVRGCSRLAKQPCRVARLLGSLHGQSQSNRWHLAPHRLPTESVRCTGHLGPSVPSRYVTMATDGQCRLGM